MRPMMIFRLTVELERESGKVASRDELLAAVRECIEDANPSELESDEGSTYWIVAWEVEET